ncbi:hypothetical protein [Woeseia oceani]|uniref:Uncharacterized protein n=1 Tax=Woeseia oceani TaxID=1548547 RepID=A0A193LGS6_9GAMM|nr:hypothetical protein [Woeseia oceani]ANO51712.1 hypothetical protein BA177_11315 [Woeseia oceani]
MKIRISMLLLALGLSLNAAADLVTVVRAVEVTTSNINVPTSTNGRMSFKPCAGECDAEFLSVRLTPATEYRVDGTALDFVDFRAAFYNLPRGKDHYALVSYDAKSSIVTSLHITRLED